MTYSAEITKSGKFNFLCLFTHKWSKIKASTTTVYWLCSRCGRKEILHSSEEYQPIESSLFLEKGL